MVLCPTTILAQQHYTNFKERCEPFGVRVEVLSRFRTPAQQAAALKGFQEGDVDVLVGTHRLLSRDVNPHDLGLVIIDEEQRFGVGHKEQMKNLRESIDVLTLSATPIPVSYTHLDVYKRQHRPLRGPRAWGSAPTARA